MRYAVLILLLFAAVAAECQDVRQVAPQFVKIEYEDARVRVVRLRVPPHASLPTHDRPARVVIALTDSAVHMTRANGSVGTVHSVAGTAVWSEPGRRSFTNLEQPIENIVVEPKAASAPAKPLAHPPSPPPPNYLAERFHHWLFENQYVRVYDVRIPPGATSDFHLHALDTVFVDVSGGREASQPKGGTWGKAEPIVPGTVTFRADSQHPRVHRVRNEGNSEYHVIVVQFLP